MKVILVLATFGFIIAAVKAQHPVTGKCRTLPVVGPFDLAKYAGKWFEIQRYDNLNQRNGDCVTAHYALSESKTFLNIVNTMKALPDRTEVSKAARGILPDAKEAKMLIRFDVNLPGTPDGNYWVLSTDYINYALVWSCVPNPEKPETDSWEYAWLLSRKETLDKSVEATVKTAIETAKLDGVMKATEQDNKKCNGASTLVLPGFLIIALVTLLQKF